MKTLSNRPNSTSVRCAGCGKTVESDGAGAYRHVRNPQLTCSERVTATYYVDMLIDGIRRRNEAAHPA